MSRRIACSAGVRIPKRAVRPAVVAVVQGLVHGGAVQFAVVEPPALGSDGSVGPLDDAVELRASGRQHLEGQASPGALGLELAHELLSRSRPSRNARASRSRCSGPSPAGPATPQASAGAPAPAPPAAEARSAERLRDGPQGLRQKARSCAKMRMFGLLSVA